MDKSHLAIVGSGGAVGQEIRRVLKKRNFPVGKLSCFESTTPDQYEGIDLTFFCVSDDLANREIPKARQGGAICIDASSAFRSDPLVPLVIPEINGKILDQHPGIISSPNCTTTLMLLPLFRLHQKWRLRRIITSTYQAVSGAGRRGIEELRKQSVDYFSAQDSEPEIFPYPCAFNVFPHESKQGPDGYAGEEKKMHDEARQILHDEELVVNARCVRVPVWRVHSLSVHAEFESPVSLQVAEEEIGKTPGVTLIKGEKFPTPIDAQEKDPVLCGPIRLAYADPNALELWIVGDQLLKGAALNMVQIAERVL